VAATATSVDSAVNPVAIDVVPSNSFPASSTAKVGLLSMYSSSAIPKGSKDRSLIKVLRACNDDLESGGVNCREFSD